MTQDTSGMFGIDHKINRPFIQRLRDDPRMKAIIDGWIAQATLTAETRLDRYHDAPSRWAHDAAFEALRLAMSFILDNDGEYHAVCEERDRLYELAIKNANLSPMVFKTEKSPDQP